MITIIGISGKKGSGKDEVLKCIQLRFPQVQRIAFADKVKEEVSMACGITVQFIEENKQQFRTILQWWGTDFRRNFKGANYWLIEWKIKLNKCDKHAVVVCPDVRFPNELETIRSLGGHVWRVDRNKSEGTDNHPSECALDTYKDFDRHIKNHESLKRLQVEVDLALEMSGLL